MELVAGGFLSAVVHGAATKAVAYLQSNYDMPKRANELLRELDCKLTIVKTLSAAADNKLITEPNLVKWLKNLHTAAQEAVDVLDEFELDETGKGKVSKIILSPARFIARLVIPADGMGRLENVVKTLSQLCESSVTFLMLIMNDSKANQLHDQGETTSHLPVDVLMFGRDEVTGCILDMIIGSSWQYDPETGIKVRAAGPGILVLPIVGMSGVGKTTLAQVIYNHAEVKDQFQRRAWVYVSEPFKLKTTLQEILRSFAGYNGTGLDTSDSMEATITKLRSKMSEVHRFFLVLDNVWDEMLQEWTALLTALSNEAREHGSVLLVTTQSHKVANIVGTVPPIDLQVLPWESLWPLFQYHAFGDMEVTHQEDNQNMLLIGEGIARKLDGFPLAAKVIGNLLRRRFSRDKWRRVAESDWWNLHDVLQGILPFLRVSYQHLSPKQRQCFAYCSIFPKNYLFDKDRVVQMWIAHDFIQSNDVADGMRLEDIGRQCFDELVESSLFQPTFVSDKYVMHDLVRGLAIAVSLHQCFFHTERSVGASSPAPADIRHLALQDGSLEQSQELPKYRNLRTLLLFGHFESDAFFFLLDGVLRNSPNLRVLDLSYVEAPGKGWPNGAKGLRKLRFLDLSFTRITKLKDLPSNLQVLHLRGYDAECFPQNITNLTNLRHLYVDDSALSKIKGIGKLTELQELDSFIARKGQGFIIRELKNMRELTGRLCIRGMENVKSKEEAMEARLIDKKHVSALVIEGKKMPKFALEGLQPHPNIEELTIKFYQDQDFPNWVLQPDNLPNLLSVNLESCRFLSTLPPLGHLPLLKLLSLRKLPSVKHVDGTSLGDFRSLEELEFQWVDKWEEWTEPDTAAAGGGGETQIHGKQSMFLGRLRKLRLEYCPSLRQLPWLPRLPALKELNISEPGSYILALPACSQVLASLTTLKIKYCNHDVVLSAHQFKSLENLCLIKCEGLRLADGFQCFGNLRSAEITGCPQLLSITAAPVSAVHGQECRAPSHEKQKWHGANLLTHLRTDNSLMNGDYFRTMGSLPSLRNLNFFDLPIDTHFSEEQELWFQQLISLECLSIKSCYKLQRLPSSLTALPSMKTLILSSLQNLHSIPYDAMPPQLQMLDISNFTADLTVRISKDGADWPSVANVPYIRVDGTTIQNK